MPSAYSSMITSAFETSKTSWRIASETRNALEAHKTQLDEMQARIDELESLVQSLVANAVQSADAGFSADYDGDGLSSSYADDLEPCNPYNERVAEVYDRAYRYGFIRVSDDPTPNDYVVMEICRDDNAFEEDEYQFIYHEPGAASDAIKPGDVSPDARKGWRYEVGHCCYLTAKRKHGLDYANRYFGEYADASRTGLVDRENAAKRKASAKAYASAASRKVNRAMREQA